MSEARSINSVNAFLNENHGDLRALLDLLRDPQLEQRLAPGEWSVRQILLHLIHSERWLQPQILLLRRAVAPPRAVPQLGGLSLPDTEAASSLAELRWAISAVREDTLRLLGGLDHDQLREPANLEVDGETLEMSLRTMAMTAADHQLFHVRQIQRTLAIPR